MELRHDDTGFGNIKIYQDPEAFCYGVDAVLLAGFASSSPKASKKGCRIMDLGTGSGIVPLILSHKTEAGFIGGIEIQKEQYQLALKNAESNGLSERLRFYNCNVKDFDFKGEKAAGSFDIVTSNPPYTAASTGLLSDGGPKAIARHEIEGTLYDFVRTASKLLKSKGDFYMVHRPNRLADIFDACRKFRLEPKEVCFVSGKPEERPNIVLIHCTKNGGSELKIHPQMYVHNENGTYSEKIIKLYEKNVE